jgi:hypothetical protein
MTKVIYFVIKVSHYYFPTACLLIKYRFIGSCQTNPYPGLALKSPISLVTSLWGVELNKII